MKKVMSLGAMPNSLSSTPRGPQRGSLDVFRNADPLCRLRSIGPLIPAFLRFTKHCHGVIEASRREHRNANKPVIAARADHHQFRHRNFGRLSNSAKLS